MKKSAKRRIENVEAGSTQPEETPLQSFASICGTLVVGIFTLTFVFQNFMIPSASMASTLLVGDHVVGDRASLAPPAQWAPFLPYRPLQRGEPVIFYKPAIEADGEQMILVKRVIGIPGDRIHLRRGIVYLNGIAQIEPRAAKIDESNYDAYRDEFPSVSAVGMPGVTAEWSLDMPAHIQDGDLVVPPEHYFVMGDNRPNSLDGRYWGFVPRANLIGRPLFVYWSFETPNDQMYKTSASDRSAFTIHQIIHFLDETRWRRTLHLID